MYLQSHWTWHLLFTVLEGRVLLRDSQYTPDLTVVAAPFQRGSVSLLVPAGSCWKSAGSCSRGAVATSLQAG